MKAVLLALAQSLTWMLVVGAGVGGGVGVGVADEQLSIVKTSPKEFIKNLLSDDCGKYPKVLDILKYSKPPLKTVVLEELAYNISPTTICATVALLENTK